MKIKQGLLNTILLILVIFFMVLFAGVLVFCMGRLRFCHVEGTSMLPNVKEDATLLINPETEYQRFDIVVFSNGSGHLIKRLIGFPGETVTVENGRLFVDHVPYEETYLDPQYVEAFSSTNFSVQVPEGEYFVLGDNRDHSFDSRELGTIKKSKILGVAIWALK